MNENTEQWTREAFSKLRESVPGVVKLRIENTLQELGTNEIETKLVPTRPKRSTERRHSRKHRPHLRLKTGLLLTGSMVLLAGLLVLNSGNTFADHIKPWLQSIFAKMGDSGLTVGKQKVSGESPAVLAEIEDQGYILRIHEAVFDGMRLSFSYSVSESTHSELKPSQVVTPSFQLDPDFKKSASVVLSSDSGGSLGDNKIGIVNYYLAGDLPEAFPVKLLVSKLQIVDTDSSNISNISNNAANAANNNTINNTNSNANKNTNNNNNNNNNNNTDSNNTDGNTNNNTDSNNTDGNTNNNADNDADNNMINNNTENVSPVIISGNWNLEIHVTKMGTVTELNYGEKYTTRKSELSLNALNSRLATRSSEWNFQLEYPSEWAEKNAFSKENNEEYTYGIKFEIRTDSGSELAIITRSDRSSYIDRTLPRNQWMSRTKVQLFAEPLPEDVSSVNIVPILMKFPLNEQNEYSEQSMDELILSLPVTVSE